MLPTPTPATPAPQILRRLARRQERKHLAAERRRAETKAKAEREEARAEQLAPQAQRMAVLGRDGKVLRGPRVEQQGITMVRSNPVKRLAARSRHKDFPTLGETHVIAADRLITAWEECHGSPVQCTNYSERSSGRGTPGDVSSATIAAANEYVRARDEILRIQARLGALWPVVHAVVICNIDPSAWGDAQGMNPDRAIGYTMAALDLLVRCYEPREERPRGQILVAEFEAPGLQN
jgi:hypothetical protein